jgi:hypothetical protein
MPGTTTQAQLVIDALTDLGLRHRTTNAGPRQFTVRTERTRRRDRGVRYTEYGDANGHVWAAAAVKVVADRADELAAKIDGTVYLFIRDGQVRSVVVSSQYARGGRVRRMDYT